ncbi:MFS transporter [Haladaptatus salinisoli]|uniref:MFS transporter n=1 Tax=Haladaptatus salinisoli TaxID=2884876 RepID=UPI001D0A2833|nr:MFS transporter [Haladaptatus salinisoli]
MTNLRRAVVTYYAYRCVSAIGFIGPFLNVFLVSRGVTFTDLALGGSAMAAVAVLGEVPSGYVGDRLGRRRSLLLSQTLFAVGVSSWAFVRSTTAVVSVFVVFGLASAFQSGSTEAWLYDALDEADEAERYTEIESRGAALRLWVTATTMVAGGFLYVVEPLAPFACAAALSWSGVAIVASLPANARYRGASTDEGGDTSLGPRRALSLIRHFLGRPGLRVVIAVVAVFVGSLSAAGDYLQPVVVRTLPRTTATVAGAPLPEFVVLGCLYATFTALSAFAVDRADALRESLGSVTALLALVGVGGAAMLVPLVGTRLFGGSLAAAATLSAIVGFRTCGDVVRPIHSAYLNDRADSAGRATTLSAVAFVGAVVRVPFLLVGGRVADATTPAVALALVGVVPLGVALGVTVSKRPLVAGVSLKAAFDDR